MTSSSIYFFIFSNPWIKNFNIPEEALNESESPKLVLEDLGSGGVKQDVKTSATVLTAIMTGFLPEFDF